VVDGRVANSWRGVLRFYRISERTLTERQQQNRLPPHDLLYAGWRYWWRSTLRHGEIYYE
jgi:hypothetical protein